MIALDEIVKSVLLRRGYSLHWYLQFAKYGADCVRELSYSTLKLVHTVALTADVTGSITDPEGYGAYVRIGVAVGQQIRALRLGKGTFNRLQNRDAKGNLIGYDNSSNGSIDGVAYGYGLADWLNGWGVNYNELGEYLGGNYGYGAGYETDIFEEFPERPSGQIQLSQRFAGHTVILDFIGDARCCDNLTKIDPMAQATVEQYIIWQMKAQARHYSPHEARNEENEYYTQLRQLRARKNPMTTEDIARIFRRGFYGAPKN